ncbi:transmembrane protein, putative (macronuclear) [Tetrahymena thermophila SB210]|uniref:Transmembrane protein, putative n=1 Tax=Tetrahymena thermophila (strain SB210) TaxID=312017 RepID=Q24I98_TETTS|nr:transmembrane protein, putative [Tetrahymena thermophila SB210]EAS07499.2 transmembrane protein, putative [Tetrahymena thermophila SB210]|eukprot:XP_001027741.2 transmembrane protein, putative [Tetrahymena thermophila SB210]
MVEATISSDSSQQNIQFFTTEGYTNFFDNSLGNQKTGVYNQVFQQNTLSFVVVQNEQFCFYQQTQLYLPFYQQAEMYKNIWINEQYLNEDNQILSCKSMQQVINNNDLITIQYNNIISQTILVIYNLKLKKVITKLNIPSSVSIISVIGSIYISKNNLILVTSYNMLFDLQQNEWVSSFSNGPSSNYINYSIQIEDAILGIDNDNMILYLYDINKRTVVQLFQNYSYYWIQYVQEQIYNNEYEIVFQDYIYLFVNYQYIVAFNLKTLTFSPNQLSYDDYGQDIESGLFSGVSQNFLYLFNSSSVIQLNPDLSVQQVISLRLSSPTLFFYYKSRDGYVLFCNKQSFFKFDLNLLQVVTIQTFVNAQDNPNQVYSLYFIGQNFELACYGFQIIHHKYMKIIKILDTTVNLFKIFYSKTETDSLTTIIDSIIFIPKVIRNIENSPYSYSQLGSDSQIIYADNQNYIVYYYIVDQNLDKFVFSDYEDKLYLFDPSLPSQQQLKTIQTFSSISSLQICTEQQTVIIQTDTQKLYVFNYMTQRIKAINYLQNPYLSLKQMLFCKKNLIVLYSPSILEYFISSGELNPNQTFNIQQMNIEGCKPYYDIDRKILVYPADYQYQFIQVQEKTTSQQFTVCNQDSTVFQYDYQYNYILQIDGKTRSIKIFDALNAQIKYLTNTANYFDIQNVYVDLSNQQIIILDQSPSLIIYQYLQNNFTSQLLQYQKLYGFVIDNNKNAIFFYDSQFIYCHSFPSLKFLDVIYDNLNYSSKITSIALDQQLNVLTVYKDTQDIILYDLQLSIYSEDLFQTQLLEIQNIAFDNNYYLIYNLRNRALSLFQFNQFKDIYIVNQIDSQLLKYAQLLKTSVNQFIYQNFNYILYASVDIIKGKIVKISEAYIKLSIHSIYYNKNLNILLIVENNSNNIYQVSLKNTINTTQLQFILNKSNNGQNIYFNGFIQNDNLIYYSQNILYTYKTNNQLISQQISTSDISLVIKLQKGNSQLQNYSYIPLNQYTNEYDNLNDDLCLIIVQNDSQIKIFNTTSQNIQHSINIDYLVVNVYVESQRQLIFIVGNQGITYIFNYQLMQISVISNPCLIQTKILSDDFFIYVFCNSQLDIYNRINLKRVYPQITLQSLHRVQFTYQKDIFILVQNNLFQVVSLSQNSSTPVILFSKDQNLLKILSFDIIRDVNSNRYLEIIALGLIDIVYYRVSLQQNSQICTYQYQQSDSTIQNNFLQKNIQLNIAYSNQFLRELRIQYQNGQLLQAPPLYGNIYQQGVKLYYFSQSDQTNSSVVLLKDGSIFDNSLITNVLINSVGIKTLGDQVVIINSKKNINKFHLMNINITEIQVPLQFNNIETLIIKNLTISNLNYNNFTDMISFQNCTNIVIENLQVYNSNFTSHSILEFVNSSSVIIVNMTCTNSQIYNLLCLNNVMLFQLNFTNLDKLYIIQNIITQIMVKFSIIQNVNLNKIVGGYFVQQLGCQILNLYDVLVTNSESMSVIDVSDLTIEVVYQSLNITIKNLIVRDSQSITLYISSNNLLMIKSQFFTIKQSQDNLMSIQAKRVLFEETEFINIRSNDTKPILYIQNFEESTLKQTSFKNNQIPLIEFFNQVHDNTIYFQEVIAVQNSCSTQLIFLQLTSSLVIQNSTFSHNKGVINGGVISILNMKQLIIQYSQFQENVCLKGNGGALYLFDVINTQIIYSTFTENQSLMLNGGALYYYSSDQVQICTILNITSQNQFSSNLATQGKGGAIFLSKVNLIIQDSKIFNNRAGIGGGMYYETIVPDSVVDQSIFQKNIFQNNTAFYYGKNLGSTLRGMEISPYQNNDADYEMNLNLDKTISIKNFQSGSQLMLKNINFLDEEQNYLNLTQLNYLNFASQLGKELDGISLQISNSNNKQDILFQGGLVSKYQDNGFSFNVSLTYMPNSNSSFKINSNLLSQLQTSQGSMYIKESQIQLLFFIEFRSCILGEIKLDILNRQICEKCPDGKYSLSQKDWQCQICPESAKSCQGSNISLKNGFWRKNNLSDTIVQCNEESTSCQESNPLSKFGCIEGYIGPLCQQCDFLGKIWQDRYSIAFQSSQCLKCSSRAYFFIFNALFFLIFQFFQIFLAMSRISAQAERYLTIYYLKLGGFIYFSKSELAPANPAYQKILIDHFQVLSIASTFKLQFPSFFNYSSQVVGNPLQISSFAFDCLYPLNLQAVVPYWFFQFLISIITPLILTLLYITFNKLRGKCCKCKNYNSRYNMTSLIYTYLFFFPSIVTFIAKSANCRQIGDQKYTQIDLTLDCRQYDQHGKFLYFAILPFAFIFVIIFPFALLLKIKQQKKNHSKKFQQSIYKFLFEDYREKIYFWDIIRLCIKSLVMITAILLQDYTIINACTNSSVLIAYYSLQMKLKPYKNQNHNYLESQSILISILTINLCLLYQEIILIYNIIGQIISLFIYTVNSYFALKLVIYIFIKPIPSERKKRNIFQQMLFRAKVLFPNIFTIIVIQPKISMAALQKLKKLKQNIKLLALYGIEKQKKDNQQFQTHFSKFLRQSTINNSVRGPLQSQLVKLIDNFQSDSIVNSEILPSEIVPPLQLQNKYFTRLANNTEKKRNNFQFRLLEMEKQSIFTPNISHNSPNRVIEINSFVQMSSTKENEEIQINEKNQSN